MNKGKRLKIFLNDMIEVLLYIVYTVSVYYIVYMGVEKEVVIDKTYRVFVALFVSSAFLYFKGSTREIRNEMIKSNGILACCKIIDDYFFEKHVDLKVLAYIFVLQLLLHVVAYFFVCLYRSWTNDHGRYTNKLLWICMVSFLIPLFAFDNVVVSFIVFGVVFLSVGYSYNKRNKKEKRQAEREAEELKQKQQKAEREEKKRMEDLTKKVESLSEEVREYRTKLLRYERKGKRKQKRLKRNSRS